MHPLIGLTTYGRSPEGEFRLPANYVEAVKRAGGVAVLLPPEEGAVGDLLSRSDGLILAGGGDIDPARYGGRSHPQIYALDPERDALELELARLAAERGVPFLAICRGIQVLNVALGGSLIEHLPDEVGASVPHRAQDRGSVSHRVSVTRGSRLAEVLGLLELDVASRHHQAIRRVAPGLSVTAHAPDGTIEGVELPDHRWLIGVQWHPELTAHESVAQQRLFDGLVRAARAFREVLHAA